MRASLLAVAISMLGLGTMPVLAEDLQPEDFTVRSLPAPGPHWFWANDISFTRMNDGRAYLFDGDTGQMLGQISAGFGHALLQTSPSGHEIYVPETYYSRGSRGERTDVLSIYDGVNLAPVGEVILPNKRYGGLSLEAQMPLSDDGKFALLYFFTPAQSVGVVDLTTRKFVGEIETPGCALVFPFAPRRFAMLCADNALLVAELDDAGAGKVVGRTEPLFTEADPVVDKAVRRGGLWYFFSMDGKVHEVEMAPRSKSRKAAAPLPRVVNQWSLTTAEEAKAGWRSGGFQPYAVHEASNRLYVLMLQGTRDNRKDPAGEVWVYDLAKRQKVQTIKLTEPTITLAVSQDAKPQVFTGPGVSTNAHVYDAATGAHVHAIPDVGPYITLIQPVTVRAAEKAKP